MTGPAPVVLDEVEADAIAELFNIGMGEPAAALSAMVGDEVVLSVPALSLTSRASIARDLSHDTAAAGAPGTGDDRVCAVRGTFQGPFAGEAMLIFPERGGLVLVRRIIPGDETADGMDEGPGEEEQDALTEIGNIILTGCLASFANLVDGELENSVPAYRAGPPGQVIGGADDPVLFVRIDVALAPGEPRGHVLFLLDIASLEAFRDAVRRAVANTEE